MLTLSDKWRTTYPDAHVGVLAMSNAANPTQHPGLNQRKLALESELRTKFKGADRAAIRALPVFQVYHRYYKRFKKSYHVQLQLESIVLKGKSIPSVAALVESMFMAELKNGLLTAGHDLDVVKGQLQARVADGSETFTGINRKSYTLKPGDMFIADTEGVLSSVIYGPDARTAMNAKTQRAVFTVYAPAGIASDLVINHLQDIEAYIRLFAPQAQTDTMMVYP